MKLEVKIQLLTFFSTVVNFIFLALGLSLFFCGVWILFNKDNLLTVLPSDELRIVGAGFLLIGGVVGVVSVIGCLSAAKENKLLLLIDLSLLIVLVLGQLYVTLLLLFNEGKVKKEVDATLGNMIEQYTGNRSQDALIDNIQHYESCCGIEDSSDWLKNLFIQNLTDPGDLLPCSCFNLTHQTTETWCSTDLNIPLQQGCKVKVNTWLNVNLLTIKVMSFSLIVIQGVLLGLVASLYRTIVRNASLKKRTLVDSDHTPLDHAPEEDLTNGEENYGFVDPAKPENIQDYF